MFNRLKKNVSSEMKSLSAIANVATGLAAHHYLLGRNGSDLEGVEEIAKRASAMTNFLFGKVSSDSADVQQQVAIEWITEDALICELVVQSLRVINTLNPQTGEIIGEELLSRFGSQYPAAPNPISYKALVNKLIQSLPLDCQGQLNSWIDQQSSNNSAKIKANSGGTLYKSIWGALLLLIFVFSCIDVMQAIVSGVNLRRESVGYFSISLVILVYLFLRRRDIRKVFSVVISCLALVVAIVSIGLVNGAANRVKYSIENELESTGYMSAIKVADPKAFEKLVGELVEIEKQEHDKGLRNKAWAKLIADFNKRYISQASDKALIDFYRSKLSIMKMLSQLDSAQCAQWAQGKPFNGSTQNNVQRLISDAMSDLMVSSVNLPIRNTDADRAKDLLDKISREATDGMAEEVDEDSVLCNQALAITQAILQLPPQDSANIIRHLHQ